MPSSQTLIRPTVKRFRFLVDDYGFAGPTHTKQSPFSVSFTTAGFGYETYLDPEDRYLSAGLASLVEVAGLASTQNVAQSASSVTKAHRPGDLEKCSNAGFALSAKPDTKVGTNRESKSTHRRCGALARGGESAVKPGECTKGRGDRPEDRQTRRV